MANDRGGHSIAFANLWIEFYLLANQAIQLPFQEIISAIIRFSLQMFKRQPRLYDDLYIRVWFGYVEHQMIANNINT